MFYISRKILKQILSIGNVWLIYREGTLGSESEKTVDHLHFHVLPYHEGLVEWNYQQIKYSAFEVAGAFRDADKLMDALIERYKNKYLKKKK